MLKSNNHEHPFQDIGLDKPGKVDPKLQFENTRPSVIGQIAQCKNSPSDQFGIAQK